MYPELLFPRLNIKISTKKTKHSFVLQLLKNSLFPYWLKKSVKNDLKEFKFDYYSEKWIFTARRWHAVNVVRIKYRKYGRKIKNESEIRKPNVTRWVPIRTFTFRNHNKGILHFLRVELLKNFRQKNKENFDMKKVPTRKQKIFDMKKVSARKQKSSI